MIQIRPARIEDAGGIALVQVESWKTTYVGIVPDAYLASLNPLNRAESWNKQIEEGTRILVAEGAVGVFGFASGGKLRDGILGFDAEIYAIYLLRKNQRRGVGTSLMRMLMKTLHDDGFRSSVVWVLEKIPQSHFMKGWAGRGLLQNKLRSAGFI